VTNPNNHQPGTGIVQPPIAMPPAVPHDVQQALANERMAAAQAAVAAAMGYPGQAPGVPYLHGQAPAVLPSNHPSVQRNRQSFGRVQPPPPPPPPPSPELAVICFDADVTLKFCRLAGFGTILVAQTTAGAIGMSFVPEEAGLVQA
jgi:hypothetical protein